MTRPALGVCVVVASVLVAGPLEAAKPPARSRGASAASVVPNPEDTAAKVDALINAALQKGGATLAGPCSDEDFLRRVSLDITGVTPSPQDVVLLGFDSESGKRAKLVERLLEDEQYGHNWARYWRDVIFLRATSQFGNIGKPAFERWMAEQLQKNAPWDSVATALLTTTGDIREEGHTALFAVHQAEPEEVAAEASRIFLGIQLQCANCHDHPTDRWKRNQFHEFAAFFPRVRFDRQMQKQPPVIQIASVEGGRDRGDQFKEMISDPSRLMRLLDRNKDSKLTREEAQRGPGGGRFLNVLLERGDTDKDGALSMAEIKNFPLPPERTGRGSAEYFMPDLDNPQSRGKQIDPRFFLAETKVASGLSDLDRRGEIARQITSVENPWFAKALVNRIWGQLLGEGFVLPIDDMGPDRTPAHPEALEVLAADFAASKYDLKWLLRTITATEAYQRQTRAKDPTKTEAFAHAIPTRLRADQLFSSLLRVVGVAESSLQSQRARMQPGGGMRFGDPSPRGQFNLLFGFDPSTVPDELNGTVPQSLFLMNEPQIQQLLKAAGPTRLAGLLQKYPSDKDALHELYLLVHTREPSERELQTCQDYIQQVGSRGEAFEDLLWSLVNSTEFLTKR